MGKGYAADIAFDLNSPMGDSTCISCGECMVSCPTGALTNKSVAGTAISTGPGAEGFEAEDLLKIPVFQGVSGTFLELNRGAIVKRRFRKGELICKEGEFGSTAFFILEGKARVSISSPMAHVKTQGGAQGFFNPVARIDGGAEPAGAGFAELHALRCLRKRLRRRARRNYATGARRIAI